MPMPTGGGPCRVCGGSKGSPLVLPETLYGTGESFDYWRCQECGCYQIASIPDDMGRFYPSEYYSFTKPKAGILRAAKLRAAALGFRLGVDILRRNDPMRPLLTFLPKTGGRVVDIGSGTAWLIYHLSLLGHHCTAVDPFADAKAMPWGVRFLKCTIDKVPGEYDLVMLMDSLEHMPDPHQAFASIARLISPTGVATLRVPIVPNSVWQEFGDCWPGLDPPRHLYTFTLDALHLLAREHGLRVRKINYDGKTWSLVAARACRAGTTYYGLPPEQRTATPQDDEEIRLANQEHRGDTVFVQLVHETTGA
jgi:SAM-dependent methyltransferase